MRIINEATFTSATISIFLYLSLLGTCIYYALRFWKAVNGTIQGGGLYSKPKFIFFVILGLSALLDLPTFLACVGKGGPTDCIWNDASYAFVWSCHLIATCGYLYAVITPSILWSDIIRQKDGNFWNSGSPLDGTKIFFRITYVIYCCVIITNVLGVIIYSKSSNESQYSDSNALGAINNCLMPVMLVVVTFGCFWSGIRLRHYVMNVQLGSTTQLRVLFKLNFTMIIICASYTMRALLVMSLYNDIPQSYVSVMDETWHYPLWMALTQWVPFLLCSFCLVNEMKFKGLGKGATNISNNSNGNVPGSGVRPPSVSVTDPSFAERYKGQSVDSVLSEYIHSETSGQSSRSRSRLASTPDSDRLDIMMTELGETDSSTGSSRRVASADNYFDSPHHADLLALSQETEEEGSGGIDHFFTMSAMHGRSQSSSR